MKKEKEGSATFIYVGPEDKVKVNIDGRKYILEKGKTKIKVKGRNIKKMDGSPNWKRGD